MSAILKFIRENHILAVIEQTIAKKKSRLCLNAYEITEIPNLIFGCYDVRDLYLHKNKIVDFPVQLTYLINLTTLTLDYNNLNTLPPEICNLKNLVNFNVSYNPLKVLIPEIFEMENLEAFWCNRTGLKEIPSEISKLQKLDTFGARGNELKTIPEEMTLLSKLRWLTLENNQIETLPESMDRMLSLVHCNVRNNRLEEFPMSMMQCPDLMYFQLNNNQISSLPDEFDPNVAQSIEVIDLRMNPICDLPHKMFRVVRYSDLILPISRQIELEGTMVRPAGAAHALALNATQLRLPAMPAVRQIDLVFDDIDVEISSESSADWENSITSSELDVHYQSEEDRPQNDGVGTVLPELSRFASTAS
ncbi:hypothetical protein ACJJTC_012910 [Scirpophaga incertulas]